MENLRRHLESELVSMSLQKSHVKDEEAAMDLWMKYEKLTSGLAQQLCEQLRLVLAPTLASKMMWVVLSTPALWSEVTVIWCNTWRNVSSVAVCVEKCYNITAHSRHYGAPCYRCSIGIAINLRLLILRTYPTIAQKNWAWYHASWYYASWYYASLPPPI